jgi:hypothetical protein
MPMYDKVVVKVKIGDLVMSSQKVLGCVEKITERDACIRWCYDAEWKKRYNTFTYDLEWAAEMRVTFIEHRKKHKL